MSPWSRAGPLGTSDRGRDARRDGTRAGGLAHACAPHRIARRCLGRCSRCREHWSNPTAPQTDSSTGSKVTVHELPQFVPPCSPLRRVGSGPGGPRADRGPGPGRGARRAACAQTAPWGTGAPAERRPRGSGAGPRAMIIPVRCFTCGKVRFRFARRVGKRAPVCRVRARRPPLTVAAPAPRTARPPALRCWCSLGSR